MDEQVNIPNNAEIDQALKEFEQKNQVEQVQKAVVADKDSELPGMVRGVIKLSGGAIKEQRQAEWILLGFIVLVIGVSIYLVIGFNAPKKPSAELLEQIQETTATMKPLPTN